MSDHWTGAWPVVMTEPNSSARPVELGAAAALTLLAVLLRWAPAPTRPAAGPSGPAAEKWSDAVRRPTFHQLLGAVFAGCALGLFIGGAGGAFAGVLVCIGTLVFASRRISGQEARARRRLIAAAAPAVDLFAAALTAGLLPVDAAAVVAAAFAAEGEAGQSPDPVHEIAARFAAASRALRQGAEPEAAWGHLAVDSATAPVAAAALRASRVGAPASETVARAARDTRGAAQQAAQAQIRAAAVRATAPLALCFLPAFVLVGVVPTALGLLTELHP